MINYKDFNINQLNEIAEEIFQNKPRGLGMKFYTGPHGKLQFDKAIRYEALREIIKRSNKSLEVKTRLYTLLDTDLETDFNLVNEIMKIS